MSILVPTKKDILRIEKLLKELMKNFTVIVLFLLVLIVAQPIQATGTYQEPSDFVSETFDGDPPIPEKLWVRKEMQADIQKIMSRRFESLRLRYWMRDDRFTYILEEIGKEKPITVGLVVEDGKIEKVKVLIFRESRGWEVRHPFFTDQFTGTCLTEDWKLDRKIDGISGATLSSKALTRLARLSLYFYGKCMEKNGHSTIQKKI